MKKLYVVGQSTCYGMDLRPGKSGLSVKDYRLKNSFGGLLADQLRYEFVNGSYPMSSLTTVTRRIRTDYDSIRPDLIIVGIPQTTVREIYDSEKKMFVNILQKEFYFPKTVLILNELGIPDIYDTDIQKNAYLNYRKNITVANAINTFESEILFLQDVLQKKKANYIFLQMAPIIPNSITEDGYTDVENTEKDFTKYFSHLDEIDLSRWVKFESFNAVDNLFYCKKGRTGHILEDGHKILQETIYETIVNSKIPV